MTFALDLKAFVEKTKGKADDLVHNIVAEVATQIDERSPVGDAKFWKNPPPKGYVGGRFRGNWQLGVGNIPAGILNRVDPLGAATLGGIIAEIPEQASGKVYFLVNNLPYAMRIEEGWSRQAPVGVVGRTSIQFQKIVDDAVAGLAK